MSLCRLRLTSILRWLSPAVGLLFCFLGVMPAGAQTDRPTTEDEVKSLPQVTIEGQTDTDQRVRKFVGDLTGKSAAEDSLARWGRPICPIVLGPPRDERAVVLGRLATIAESVGLHIAKRPCDANFFIVESSEPERLLTLWHKKDDRMFGDGLPSAINHFLTTAQPVRVWYNTALIGMHGNALQQTTLPGQNVSHLTNSSAEDSRIKLSDVLRFNSVIVVVDIGRTQDIKLGQLADYIAMVGLARIHLDADFDVEPTILRIFTASAAESGEAAPSSITDWDLDFLKALYSTSQSSRLQRAAIADRMLRDIAH